MLDTLYIETVEQADALLKPKRVEVLRQLAEPHTCTQIGQVLGETPQAVYYHVKRLQAHGLVELVEEHRVRGITEGVYRAVARSFWVAPDIVGRLGPPRAREALLGLGFLLDLSEEMSRDLAALAAGAPSLPSFGIAGDITLRARGRRRVRRPSSSARSARCSSATAASEGHGFRLDARLLPQDAEPRAASARSGGSSR